MPRAVRARLQADSRGCTADAERPHSQTTHPHTKVDLLFPHAPMLGGLDPCVSRGGGGSGSGVGVEGVLTSGVAMEGDVGAICQNRSLPPMHDPALL